MAEGPAFSPALTGRLFGVDFNPTVDKIRVTSDAGLNLRLNVDEGTVLMNDAALDTISVQNPPNNGTLTNPKPLSFDVRDQAGFDIAGSKNLGYIATLGSAVPRDTATRGTARSPNRSWQVTSRVGARSRWAPPPGSDRY